MDDIREILNRLLKKECSVEEAEILLKANAIEEVGDFAKLDIFRKARTGIFEVIYAENKKPEVIVQIINSFLKKNRFAIVSRYREESIALISKEFENNEAYSLDINDIAKTLIVKEKSYKFEKKRGKIRNKKARK